MSPGDSRASATTAALTSTQSSELGVAQGFDKSRIVTLSGSASAPEWRLMRSEGQALRGRGDRYFGRLAEPAVEELPTCHCEEAPQRLIAMTSIVPALAQAASRPGVLRVTARTLSKPWVAEAFDNYLGWEVYDHDA